MYLEFLGLQEKPFSNTADPAFLYLSRKHREALSHMVFGIRELIAFFSQMTLEPGDIISSGTCSGVASRMKPEPKYLKPGDVVECEVEGLGVLRNTVVAPE